MHPAARLAVLLLLTACGRGVTGPTPRQIHIAGSDAAFPFSAAAAERVMREQPNILAPLVRAGGSGAGITAFCGGPGLRFPDIVVVTRPPTDAELRRCRGNGVDDVAQVTIGRTAFVLVSASPLPGLDRAQLYRALVGPARRWSAIDPRWPDAPIRIHGPAPAPRIADGLYDRLLGPGCVTARGADCGQARIRGDGAYVGHGADAELVAAAVLADPGSIGILPFAQAQAHADRLRPIALDGVEPTAGTIATGTYPASAPLILLAKPQTLSAVPGTTILLSYYAQGLQHRGGFVAEGLVPTDDPAAAARQLEIIGHGGDPRR